MTTVILTEGQLADAYLDLKAEKAELAQREAALRTAILETGKRSIEGRRGRVTVSHVAGKLCFSMKLAKLYLTDALLAKVTTRGKPTTKFDVRARVAETA